MKPTRCTMVPLLEARRDGRLGDRESASLDRHLAGCASCRALERDLDRLRTMLQEDDPRPTPLEHQRGRLRLLRAAALPPPLSRRPLARRAPSLAVACAVVVSLAGFAIARHLPGSAHPPEAIAAASTLASAAAPMPPAPAEPAPPLPRPDEGTVALGEPPPHVAPAEEAPAPVSVEPKRAPAMRTAIRMPAPAPRAPRRPETDTSKAFGEAMTLLGRGDYAAAHAQLDAFRAAHPTDARADLAAFLAIVSLQHAGRNDEAREAARRYLALYPDGDRRADAAKVAYERTPSP